MKETLEQIIHALTHYSEATINDIEKNTTLKATKQIKELQTKINKLKDNDIDINKTSAINEIVNLLTTDEEELVFSASKKEWESLFETLEENYNIHMINPNEYLQLHSETEIGIEYSARKIVWDAIWEEVGEREEFILK
ncbi:hypothetical protein [Bacillus toyonensis]|uniref:hypothetical protein n=1 Tax=Bacillus toyonensis TaxID=155322 RepID=UPI002E1D3BE4|nr:hypothetical protein [Bacillus toyonensis]